MNFTLTLLLVRTLLVCVEYELPVNPLEVVGIIAEEGTEWTYRNGQPGLIKESSLTYYAKGLHKFVSAHLMPSKHISDVTWDRAVLIYTILEENPVDVGRLINAQLTSIIRQTCTGGFCFPSLITELCQEAGVMWGRDSEIQPAKPLITKNIVTRGRRRAQNRTDCQAEAV